MPIVILSIGDIEEALGQEAEAYNEDLFDQFLDEYRECNIGLDKNWTEQVQDAFRVWLNEKLET
jgi:hypothetical protein